MSISRDHGHVDGSLFCFACSYSWCVLDIKRNLGRVYQKGFLIFQYQRVVRFSRCCQYLTQRDNGILKRWHREPLGAWEFNQGEIACGEFSIGKNSIKCLCPINRFVFFTQTKKEIIISDRSHGWIFILQYVFCSFFWWIVVKITDLWSIGYSGGDSRAAYNKGVLVNNMLFLIVLIDFIQI